MTNILAPLINHIFIPFLVFAYGIIPNYGIGIIFLTVLVKLAFYPLTKKQFQSMQVNQKLQPKVKAIQEKHKDEPQKAQQEILKLWKENNANPFIGCLPMLVQIPFFFAIFATMRSETFLNMITTPGVNPGFLPFWLTNLGHPDPFFILPILIGILTWWSQKMFITDPKQASLFMFMPVLMTFICLRMPTGVLLYWVTSQFIQSIQQYLMTRSTVEEKE